MIFEIRFYSTGWAIRVGLLQLRYNQQLNYKGLSLEWLDHGYFNAGGMTWKEFKLARAQAKADALKAKQEGMAKQAEREAKKVKH